MSGKTLDRWRGLLRDLNAQAPPRDMKLYVKPKHGCADDVVSEFLADPASCPKILLVGATGGGKSTELREIARRLAPEAAIAPVDLDASGVTAASLTALDLLYASALAVLKLLPEPDAQPLFAELAERYAGKSGSPADLGTFAEALAGVSGFAEKAGTAAVAAGAVAGGAPPIAAGAVATSLGLRLIRHNEPISETSPRGRSLQETCIKIDRAVRTHVARPLCVLIDGFEKMNGQAPERFDEVFVHTRLLADTKWAAVIAAPPSTLTRTSAALSCGYTTKTVWGFGPDDLGQLQLLLERRFTDCQLDPLKAVATGGLKRIVDQSGGLPRFAVRMTREAVRRALTDDSPTLTDKHIDAGIRALGEELGQGLREEDLQILRSVDSTRTLPGDDRAAKLFADGRILAYPSQPPSNLPRFFVHPLLKGDVPTA